MILWVDDKRFFSKYHQIFFLSSLQMFNAIKFQSNVYMIKEYVSDENSNPTGNYKIGFSATLDKRIRALRAGNSRSLDFQHKSPVKSVQDAKKAEQEIHEALKEYRIKKRAKAGTEWFYVDANHFHDFEQKYIQIAEKYICTNLCNVM